MKIRALTRGLKRISAAVGDPVKQRYLKEVVKTGHYVKDSENREFDITGDMLENWVVQFHSMNKNGVDVTMPSMHDFVGDPDKNRGYVRDMFIEGDSLMIVAELIGQDAIDAAPRCNVSISTELEVVDCKGNKYAEPIVHIALCTDPLFTNLGEFVPIAASRRRKEKNMNWDAIKTGLEIEAEMTDDNAGELILAKLSEFKESTGEKIADLEATIKASRKEEGRKPEPMLVKLASDNRRMKIETLVSAGRITPDIAKKADAKFVGKDGGRVELSIGNSRGDGFDDWFDLAADNDPVKLKEQTRAQTLHTMHDDNKSSAGDNVLVCSAKRRAKEAEKRGLVSSR